MVSKKRKGVLTVEAALVMPIFVLAIFAMMEFTLYLRTYDKVQTEISNNARIFAKASYFLADLGVDDFMTDLQAYDASMNPKKVLRNAAQTSDVLELVGGDSFSSNFDKYNNGVVIDVQDYKKVAKDRAKFAGYAIFSVVNYILDKTGHGTAQGGINEAMTNTLTSIVQNSTEARLDEAFNDNYDSSDFIKLPSGKYLDFTGTKYSLGTTDEIQIVVSYRLKLSRIFGKNLCLPIKQRVAIKPWGGI